MTKHVSPRGLRGIVSVRADATADIKGLIETLNKSWTEFKAEMEAKDKELAKRFDDVVTTEKLEKLNAHISDLQKAVDDANAKLEAARLGAGRKPDRVKDQQYTANFRKWMQEGDEGIPFDVRSSLKKVPDSDGGYLAPVEWDRTITDKLIEVSPMRQIASVQTISTAGFSKVFNLRGTASGWVGEQAARTETGTPTFGSMTFRPGEVYANPAATQQVLDDAEVDLETWLAGEVDTEFAYQEGLAFIAGDGTNKPYGFLTFVTGGAQAATNPLGSIEVIDAASSSAVASDEIIDLIYALPSAFTMGARFVMNRTTQGVVRKLKDGDGNYLWQPSFQAGQPPMLAGYPVTEMPGMPDIGPSAIPIAFGDFRRGYLIVDRTGIRVLRDPYTNKPYVHFYTTKRVGGGVQNPETIKVLRMAA